MFISLRRTLILITLAAAAFFPVSAPAQQVVTVNDGVTLIVFRHADRDPGVDKLNATGVARAAALPGALVGQKIDVIYRPEIARNLETVIPLAAERSMDITAIGAFGMPDKLASTAAGQSVVWVGNKDNLKRLWIRTAAPGVPPLQYGDLFIVSFPAGAPPQVIRGHFGD